MYKYKYFLLLFCILIVSGCWIFFPICFDNNDDQAMYAIYTGMFSGLPSSNLLLSNILIGKLLVYFFSVSKSINWYTLYLQTYLALCFIYFVFLFIKPAKIKLAQSVLWVLILFSGFFAAAIVKPQFTTIALFGIFVSLLSLAEPILSKFKIIVCLLFLTVSMLIRIEVLYVFIVFLLPYLMINRDKNYKIQIAKIFAFVCAIFLVLTYINSNNDLYSQQQSYTKVSALDNIAAKPIKINENALKKYNYTVNDLNLIQSWLLADEYYFSNSQTEKFAKQLKTRRDFFQIKAEWKKFVSDERYPLGLYIVSFLIILLIIKTNKKFTIFNVIIFLSVLIYLTAYSRIPHRIMFPILCYLVLVNLYFIAHSEIKQTTKTAIVTLFTILSLYKLYCVSQLIPLHKTYHITYAKALQKINTHPEILFIGADGFPLQYLNAWQTTEHTIISYNLIPTGWYACSPDYKQLLNRHQLHNLTSNLKHKKKVVFLTDSEVLQNAYVQVMKERYGILCHFKDDNTLAPLHAKWLIIDN